MPTRRPAGKTNLAQEPPPLPRKARFVYRSTPAEPRHDYLLGRAIVLELRACHRLHCSRSQKWHVLERTLEDNGNVPRYRVRAVSPAGLYEGSREENISIWDIKI